MEDKTTNKGFENFIKFVINILDVPVTWFRETIVVPNRPKYYYYHQKFRRVPTIDECEEDEPLCMYEANEQWKRDRAVDNQILNLLRRRIEQCFFYEDVEADERCQKVVEDFDKASLNYFIKYGDLKNYSTVKHCYMKQKHRMVWERREAEGKNRVLL